MWRKTRSPTADYDIWGYRCYGVDPNRNWDHYWNSTYMIVLCEKINFTTISLPYDTSRLNEISELDYRLSSVRKHI